MGQYDLEIGQALQQLDHKMNQVAGGLRKYVDEKSARDLALVTSAMKASRSGSSGFGADDKNGVLKNADGIVRLEDIPGRRVPFIYTVEIPIGSADTSERRQSFTISQDGPFVATRRMATFLSQHSFAYTDPESNQQTTYNGQSNGRFRPISSDSDICDAQHAAKTDTAGLLVASRYGMNSSTTVIDPPMVSYAQASNMSSFRTMEWDGYLSIINSGSSYPRQNRPIPSAFWSKSGCGAGVELPALDFFERSEVVDIVVQPTHPNNAPYGNAAGAMAWLNSAGNVYPFLNGQYDAHEGIATPLGAGFFGKVSILSSDPITRLPEGILIVALEGYRIIQPPGAPF